MVSIKFFVSTKSQTEFCISKERLSLKKVEIDGILIIYRVCQTMVSNFTETFWGKTDFHSENRYMQTAVLKIYYDFTAFKGKPRMSF